MLGTSSISNVVLKKFAFSTWGYILNPCRNLLPSKTAKDFVYVKNWMRTKAVNIGELEECLQLNALESKFIHNLKLEILFLLVIIYLT